MGLVYLIHANGGLPNGTRLARHYIGYTDDRSSLLRRVGHHRAGSGARVVRAYSEAGLDWRVVRVWEGASRTFERQLKNRHEAPRFCPCCSLETGQPFKLAWPDGRPARASRYELETMRSGLAWARSAAASGLRCRDIALRLRTAA